MRIIRENTDKYMADESNYRTGGGISAVYIPEDPAETAAAVGREKEITVYAGGTGIAGGAAPLNGAVISTERLKGISVDAKGLTVEAGAGVTLEELHIALAEQGLWYPVDPTEQSATIGGNAATNSSGARSLKYGSIREFILGLGIVLADGSYVELSRGQAVAEAREGCNTVKLAGREYAFPAADTRSGLPPKNNAGYFMKPGMDLIDLFIGSEGTLGIITGVRLKVLRAPAELNALMIFTGNAEKAWRLAALAKEGRFGMAPLSVEYMDGPCIGFLKENGIDPGGTGPAVFMEFEGELDGETAATLQKEGIDPGSVMVSSTLEKKNRIYGIRESLPERINGYIRSRGLVKISTDFCFPAGKASGMAAFYGGIGKRTGVRHLIFGHLGDNNLHVNFLPADEKERKEAAGLYGELLKEVVAMGGVFASEHGVGKLKKQFLPVQFGPAGMSAMRAVKEAFDPGWKLCPGNILDREGK